MDSSGPDIASMFAFASRLGDVRVIARWRTVAALGLLGFLAMLAGCSETLVGEPIAYDEPETMTQDVAGEANLAGKPRIQEKVREAMARVFGGSPRRIVVPEGAPLTGGEMGRLGIRLANYVMTEDGPKRIKVAGPKGGAPVNQVGGYALFHAHCLQCHGISGGGDGPTAPFLYPPPRDYRRGLFKFTSTPNGARPARDDLRRTIRHGLPGTSMPAFGTLLSEEEVEQLVDYVTFLSFRGETELGLIEEGYIADEEDEDAISDEIVDEIVQAVFRKWETAARSVVAPPVERTPSTQESILRGRDLFLGRTKERLECVECHGPKAHGDGSLFVSQDVFNKVFYGDPAERDKRVEQLDEETRARWEAGLDAWGNPLRPANLNNGSGTFYKGGNRPLDLYWRIAKGITGARMPAHYPAISAEQVWDLVNFVLALPDQPELLDEEAPPPSTAAKDGTAHR